MTLQAPDWENSSNSVYTWSRYRLTGFAAAHDCRTLCRTFQFPDLLSIQQSHSPSHDVDRLHGDRTVEDIVGRLMKAEIKTPNL